MRLTIVLITTFSILFATELNYPVQSQRVETSQFTMESAQNTTDSRNTREDTTTLFFEDFEGDLSGWTVDPEWELTEDEYSSPTHSYHIDDNNYDVTSSLISPTISFPEIDENSAISFSFMLNCNLVDFDGDGDNFLEDYYFCDVADMSASPWHVSEYNAYEGNSWWCGSEDVGGYLDGWLQFLDTPELNLPAEGTTDLTFKLFYAIEIPGDYPPYNGWDAANIRISNDNFETWDVLDGSPAYDFTSGYGWGYNGEGADIPGWGGYSGGSDPAQWIDATFDLSNYAGQAVKIRFAFGSDPAYSTVDDASIIGFFVDNVEVSNSNEGVLFTDNADDQTSMTAQGLAWDQVFYDYGDITRPGGLGWDSYDAGDPFNGNIMLDLSDYAGSDIRFRWRVRLDENDDGGDGDGLFIDDFHVWEVNYNVVPTVQNLDISSGDSQVTLTWDMPPSESYDNDEVAHDDGSPENSWAWGLDTVRFGTVFDMPYGTESVVVHSASFAPNSLDDSPISAVIEAYNVSPIGIPETEAAYSTTATLEDEAWTSVEFSNWTFEGDFLIALVVDSTVYMSIDEDATTGYSYISSPEFGSDSWFRVNDILEEQGGEWLIRATVTTTGTTIEPGFNVYRDPGVNGSEWQLMFNGQNISQNYYVDNLAENGVEYCYKVSALYGEEESDLAGPVCAVPEAETIYEIAYDDGESETSINAGTLNLLAVKFTPDGYPADLYRASFYTVGNTNGVGLVHVWDDDGENGMPGTILLDAYPVTFVGDSWKQVPLFDFGITITEGSFYVGWMETDQTPAIGVDSDNSADNSIIDIGGGWETFANYFDGAMMIRAELDSANVLSVEDRLNGNVPGSFRLNQNYPNPFNPTTSIEFDLASAAFTSLALYDVTGREVKTLVNRNLHAGHYVFGLNAGDLPSGMYFYKLTAQDHNGQMIFTSTKKMVLMK